MHRRRALALRSGGNPLFLTELAGNPSVTDGEALPDSLEGLVTARIDRLPPPARALLRAASVLGMRCESALLDELIATSPMSISSLDQVDGLLAREGEEVHFLHQLVRDCAYGGLPFRARRDLHRRAARLLGLRATTPDLVGLLAVHSFCAGEYDAALEHSVTAARHARAQYANTEALHHYRRAVEAGARRTPEDRDRRRMGRLWWELADIQIDLGDLAAAADSLQRARRLVPDDPVHRARTALSLVVERALSDDHRNALAWATRALRDLEGVEGGEAAQLRSEAHRRRALARLGQGRLVAAARESEDAVRTARSGRVPGELAHAVALQASILSELGRPVDLDLLLSSSRHPEVRQDLRRSAWLENAIGVTAFNQSAWEISREAYLTAERLYVEMGRPIDIALQQANQAEVLIFQGSLEEEIGRAHV